MNTIKDYYVEIQKLYNSSLKILTALNTALASQSATVPLTLLDDDSVETVYNIPSFLYLENKMLRMQDVMDSVMNIPESGEAWFTQSGKTYRLNMLSANNAPAALYADKYSEPGAVVGQSSIFKDLVFPKLSLRCRVENLSPDVTQISYKKVVFYSKDIFSLIRNSSSSTTLQQVTASLGNLEEGTDYDIYENTVTLPLRSRDSRRLFSIQGLVQSDTFQTYGTLTADNCDNPEYFGKRYYDVEFENIQYSDESDPSRIRTLRAGMTLQASSGYAKVILEDPDPALTEDAVKRDNIFRIIVTSGSLDMHVFEDCSNLTWSEAYDTYLTEDDSWIPYSYVDIPLEENPYICLFIAAVRNNIRSVYTSGTFYDLNEVYMVDDQGSAMVDENNSRISYIDYYNKFAKNAGDILMSLIYTSEPGADTLTRTELSSVLQGDGYKPVINSGDLTVTAVNTHLSDDTALDEIKTLHVQKSELSSELSTVRGDIQNIMSLLANTDFTKSQDTSRASLQVELNDLYAKRTELEKQVIHVVNDINTKANASVVPVDDIKYRLRGHISVSALETALKDKNITVAGLDIQYKYKSVSKDTTVASALNSAVFTSWNRCANGKRNRVPYWENGNLTFVPETLSDSEDVIKWNQVDIPIQQGEDVVVRVRALYNIGQPFVNLYSPWSDERTFEFPSNFTVNADVQSILQTNKEDSTGALLTSKLIEDGYEEHVSNKIVDNDAVFFHQPENIASGFFTQEQKIISLREKLVQMSADVDSVNLELENIKGLRYDVSLSSDDREVTLQPDVLASFPMKPYLEHQEEAANRNFVSVTLSVNIRNSGSSALRLHSLFPGDQSKMLTNVLTDQQMLKAGYYEMYPVYAENGWITQKQGQWIYFRCANPYTSQYDPVVVTETFKYDSLMKNSRIEGPSVFDKILDGKMKVPMTVLSSSKQPGLRYRNHDFMQGQYNLWGEISLENGSLNINTPVLSSLESQSNHNQGHWIPINFAGRYDGLTWDQLKSQVGEDVEKTWKSLSASSRAQYRTLYGVSDDSLAKSAFLEDYLTTMSDGWDLGLGYLSSTDLANVFSEDGKTRALAEGAFLFPEVQSESTLFTAGSAPGSYLEVPAGQSVSVPVTFQYYLSEDVPQVSKYMYFDIRPSVAQDPVHYLFKITARYSESSAASSSESSMSTVGE